MENQPEAKRTRTEDNSFSFGLSSWERKGIFDIIYKFNPSFSFELDHELFQRNYEELELALKYPQFNEYFLKLKATELEFEAKVAEYEAKKLEKKKIEMDAQSKIAQLESENQAAKTKFLIKTGAFGSDDPYFKDLVDKISLSIEDYMLDLVEDRLDDEGKVFVAKSIMKYAWEGTYFCDKLLTLLQLKNVVQSKNCIIPLNSEGTPHSPSTIDWEIQKNAFKYNANHIYAFPFYGKEHFPVLFCHPVFVDFMDIMHGRNSAIKEYEKFYNDNCGRIGKNLDLCVCSLIETVLKSGENQDEDDFLNELVSAFDKLFKTTSRARFEDTIMQFSNTSIKGAAVFLGYFPYIIIKANINSYSINSVIQGLQCYGLIEYEYIDNDPCFLITIDKGIFYLYGLAKVNRRVVCTCLLSLEFTCYLFNIGGFLDKLHKCFGALFFFYEKFAARMLNQSQGSGDSEYNKIKFMTSLNDQPYPAIFSVKSVDSASDRIMITFQNVTKVNNNLIESVDEPYFNPRVYMVKTASNEKAVLKLAHNYNIEIHKKMASVGLAPKIIGYEELCGSYHIILMEYNGDSYDILFNHLKNYDFNGHDIYKSLQGLTEKFKEFNIVHGDFRSCNILVKRSLNNPSVIEDFKLIDFEFSGNVYTPYPFMSLLNQEISWPKGFNSYMPRKLEHDQFMLEKIKIEELNYSN